MTSLKILQENYNKTKEKTLHDFFTFLSFESISTDPQFKPQVLSCADWLINYIKKIGLEVEIWPTSGYPVIFASYMKAGPKAPTLLIYNHYDVQPVDPIDKWVTPPFKPTIREGEIYARGAQDNKGQCFYTLQALKALLEKDGKIPINIKMCIEGEEECGSAGLAEILPQRKKELKADYAVIVDVGIPDMKTPAVNLGVRGLVTLEVEVQGSKVDMHSGSHGGILYNPIHALIEMVGSLRDRKIGKILIPGFYDDIIPFKDEERAHLFTDFNEDDYLKDFGAKAVGGEKAFSPLERNWIRPTLEINGINGGYTGAGFKTVIPAYAYAKISCRLVPNQDPLKVGKLVSDYLIKQTPEGLITKVNILPGRGKAIHARPDSKVAQSFAKAYEDIFKSPCKFILSGASIPILAELAEMSEAQPVLVGLGLDTDQIHSPNEHFGVDRLEKGCLMIARAIEHLA
jgi:acetylornithine deacetylase/succinyl-diaminopimelate desuccinylase-like protein